MTEIDNIRHRMTRYGDHQFTLQQFCREFLIGESEAWQRIQKHRLQGLIRILNYDSFITFRVSTKPSEIKANLRENLKAFEKQRREINKLIKQTRELCTK
jgi:hypothetical protein